MSKGKTPLIKEKIKSLGLKKSKGKKEKRLGDKEIK
jgi:hypothetical protein